MVIDGDVLAQPEAQHEQSRNKEIFRIPRRKRPDFLGHRNFATHEAALKKRRSALSAK
jgi:hypothetical protein